MKTHITIALLTLVGCATTDDTEQQDGPPHVADSEILGSGKGDGALALGTSKVLGQQSGYRSDDADFSCTQGGKVAYDITYTNTSLPWGVTLDLWRGMAGEQWCGGCEPAWYGTFDWDDHQVVRMTSSGPYQWSVHTESYGYGAGAGGRFNFMRYVVRITMPDGSTRWDNGGSNWGYYQVPAPAPKCQASWDPWKTYDSDYQDLTVLTVPKY